MLGAGSELGGNGPVAPEAVPLKGGREPVAKRNGTNAQTKGGKCHSGLGGPWRGLLDQRLSGSALSLPSTSAPRAERKRRSSGQPGTEALPLTFANAFSIVVEKFSAVSASHRPGLAHWVWLTAALLSAVAPAAPGAPPPERHSVSQAGEGVGCPALCCGPGGPACLSAHPDPPPGLGPRLRHHGVAGPGPGARQVLHLSSDRWLNKQCLSRKVGGLLRPVTSSSSQCHGPQLSPPPYYFGRGGR